MDARRPSVHRAGGSRPRATGRVLAAVFASALACGAAPAPAARAQDGPAPADSAGAVWTVLPELVVRAAEAAPPAPGSVTLPEALVASRDPGTLADVGGLLPSVRVSFNSRGEAALMIRGAPERHVQTFLDGIPLNLPWDERTDLECIPMVGAARLQGSRGLATLLEGPGVLAGSVRILPATSADRARTVTAATLGDHGLTSLDVSRQGPAGSWHLLGAGGWRMRDAWPLPGDHPLAGAQPLRENSDLDQYALLLRAGRPVAGTGRLNLLVTAWHQSKGVPPELHLGEDARYWRYPERRRVLAGISLARPLDAGGRWDLSAMAAGDYFDQEIDPRGPDGWDAPPADGQDYEQDFDRTAHAVLGLTRWLGDRWRVTLQGNARYAHHRESLAVGGGTTSYAQRLTCVVVDAEGALGPGWTLRAGAGWDAAATPQSGDKPARAADDAYAWQAALTRSLGQGGRVFAAASQRSRFPSLRELFSGALGKFVPNPDLRPERQRLYEAGAAAEGADWSAEAGVFLQDLADGIEKESIPDSGGRFRRVNRTAIRVPGCEAMLRLRPAGDLELTLQHTILVARAKIDDAYDGPTEDRPDYLSRLAAAWAPPLGPGALAEVVVTGPRWSADASGASDAAGGLRRLPAGAVWNLRAGWTWRQGERQVEAHVRLDNAFDQLVEYQVGLPAPGRILSAGLRIAI